MQSLHLVTQLYEQLIYFFLIDAWPYVMLQSEVKSSFEIIMRKRNAKKKNVYCLNKKMFTLPTCSSPKVCCWTLWSSLKTSHCFFMKVLSAGTEVPATSAAQATTKKSSETFMATAHGTEDVYNTYTAFKSRLSASYRWNFALSVTFYQSPPDLGLKNIYFNWVWKLVVLLASNFQK